MANNILGVDPGSNKTGIGIINKIGNKIALVHHQVIDCSKLIGLGPKLKKIFLTIKNLIDEYHPEAVVLEKVFVGPNANSTILLSHVRGAAFACAVLNDITVFEYASKDIKMSVTGYGRAEKLQVQKMVKIILNQLNINMGLDESDALAAAICHANRLEFSKFIK